MPGEHKAVRILVIQRWTEEPTLIERALRDAGVDALLVRVDFQAALDAALAHDQFDVAIFDPSTPGLTHETVEACLRIAKRVVPVVTLGDLATIGTRVLTALARYSN